jgi:hypothetical protein
MPSNVPIIYALDQDFTTSQLAGPISEYVRGLHSVAGDDAVYGGYRQLAYLIRHGSPVKQNFQTYAWSGGKWLPVSEAPVEQFHNGVKVAGGTVDDCRVQDNLTFWEKDMPLSKADGQVVWDTDTIANPKQRADHDSNPRTQADFAVGDMWQRICDLQDAVTALKAAPGPTAAEVAAEIIKQLGGPSG